MPKTPTGYTASPSGSRSSGSIKPSGVQGGDHLSVTGGDNRGSDPLTVKGGDTRGSDPGTVMPGGVPGTVGELYSQDPEPGGYGS